MFPATAEGYEAKRILEQSIAMSCPTRIDWTPGKIVILDNWKLLHGREPAEWDEERVLLRVLVMDQNRKE
jgi:alpha-ketoglutarate-dependent taurine dioxygenase